MPSILSLNPHPDTPCANPAGIVVALARRADGGLALTFRATGDPAGLAIPAPATPARTDGLWRHTCFEAFVRSEGQPGYREFNLSPSGRWAAYAFRAYRADAADLPMAAPTIAWQRHADRVELAAVLPAAALPDGPLRLGLAAVIEQADGRIGYWALRHPAGKPDFHHTDAFALVLP